MKTFLCFTLALFLAFASHAQYAQVTHTIGTQAVAGVNITVTRSGTAFNIPLQCGVFPYWIGWNTVSVPGYGQYTYVFNPGVPAVKMQFSAFSTPGQGLQEIDSFFVNGSHYPITATNISPYPGPCNQGQCIVVNGNLVGNTTGGGQGAEVVLSPGFPITSLKISTNGLANGNVYSLFIDSVGFMATSNSTVCAGDTLKLFSTTVPGATYSWTGPNGFSSGLQNPVIPAATPLASGVYTATAQLPGSTMTDTVIVSVSPASPPPVVTSPVQYCLNDNPAPLTAAGTGLLWYTAPAGGTGSSTAPVPSTATAGTTTYYVSQMLPGFCRGPRTPVQVVVAPSPDALFSFTVHYGCSSDTVIFQNTSVSTANTTFNWDFGDGTGDTAMSPVHIFTTQSSYNVRLTASNGLCKDSFIAAVDVNHPLAAAFNVDEDSLCQNEIVSFTSTSVATSGNGIDPVYTWDFGDGSPLVAGPSQNAAHRYSRTGVYTARLIVTDFVPCRDTAYRTIVVDSVPYIRLIVDKDTACEGEGIGMSADYLRNGDLGLHWDFGDGTAGPDNSSLTHAYDTSGTYVVTITASYRQCNDTAADTTIVVKPYPQLNIGKDTALCVGGAPIRIGDLSAGPGAYRWNTGDTTATILARNYGSYYATVSVDGCSSTDTVTVKKDCYLDVPNVFTPNADGVNDFFWPRGLLSQSITRFSMSIFNRWGQKIWETRSINGRGWDGKFNGIDQPEGVYVYLLEADLANGHTEKYQGNVTLMR